MSNCIIFSGGKGSGGYGIKWRKGRTHQAHRLVWEDANGPIPNGQIVRHLCDTPACINIEHLSLGTQQDNLNDMVARGRSLCGEKHPRCKLEEKDIAFIRLAQGVLTQKRLADMFGVVQPHISRIHRSTSWGHLNNITKGGLPSGNG